MVNEIEYELVIPPFRFHTTCCNNFFSFVWNHNPEKKSERQILSLVRGAKVRPVQNWTKAPNFLGYFFWVIRTNLDGVLTSIAPAPPVGQPQSSPPGLYFFFF